MPAHRHRASIALAVLAGVLATLGGLAAYVRSELVDERAFSQRVAAAIADDDVREVVADRTVDALVEGASADLLAVRPLLASGIEALVATRPFRRLFELAVADAHGALLGEEPSFVLELPRAGALLLGALRSMSPDVAELVPADVQPQLARLDPGELELGAARTLADLSALWWVLLALAVVAGAGALTLALDRRRGLARVAAGVATAGAVLSALVIVGGAALASHAARAADLEDDRERAAVLAVWNSLFGDLRTGGFLVAFAGVAVSAVAAGILHPDQLEELLDRARAGLRSPRPGVRAVRGLVLTALGVLAVFEPLAVLTLAGFAAGAVLVFLGVADLAAGLDQRVAVRRPAPGRHAPLLVAGLAMGAIALTAVAVVLVLPAPPAIRPLAAVPASGCNGSEAACRRRLNEVVFPATHNSFAAAEQPGWLFANQRYPIARQLRDGIRGLLLDVHYGIRDPETGRVRTDLNASGISRNRVARELSPEALQTADRLAGGIGLGQLTGAREPYLCHTLCELGAEPLEEELRVLKSFLDERPHEVVVLLLEPYVPPTQIEESLRRAGLLELTAELGRDEPLPTLAELVESDRRLVVFTESGGGTSPWYLPGFSFVQDTPLGATQAAELRCGRFRGSDDSPILMLNHWIDHFPPAPSANARIAGRFLRERVERCAVQRGLAPGILAVDFYERSGVIAIAEALNRG